MMNSHEEHQTGTTIIQEKEVTVENIRAVASFPPFEINKETAITVKVSDKETGTSVSGAEIVARASFQDHTSHETQQLQSSEYKATEHESGTYMFSFTPASEGECTVAIRVLAIQERSLTQPIVIETTRDVGMGNQNSHQGGMHNSGGASTMLIIGGVLMGAMMLGMLVWNGGML
ncbi:MAG: hypothetical protein EPO24_04775 [Bacteroidetes bacterium]|nr:MAG: hypothetical protein EPO24_04775 [Bacteroidota bacterium]